MLLLGVGGRALLAALSLRGPSRPPAPCPKLADEQKEQVLVELVASKPDAFCRELADDLFARAGARVCRQTIGTRLDALGVTRTRGPIFQLRGTLGGS